MKAKPLSLYPLKFKDVIKDVLQVKPEPRQEKKKKQKGRKSSGPASIPKI